jgi:hypothetical protein
MEGLGTVVAAVRFRASRLVSRRKTMMALAPPHISLGTDASPRRHPRTRLRIKQVLLHALAPLGVGCFYEAEGVAEFGGTDGTGPTLSVHVGEPTERVHLAFAASNRDSVDAF